MARLISVPPQWSEQFRQLMEIIQTPEETIRKGKDDDQEFKELCEERILEWSRKLPLVPTPDIPPMVHYEEVKNAFGRPRLPPQTKSDACRLTVVLDMDHTLLYSQYIPDGYCYSSERLQEILQSTKWPDCTRDNTAKPIDFETRSGISEIDPFFDDNDDMTRCRLRPGLKEFLFELSKEFEPILFTASNEGYAAPQLDKIEGGVGIGGPPPNHLMPLFRHRLYRDSTVIINGPDGQTWKNVKDLAQLGRDMGRIVLIEDNENACVANPDNCILVADYEGAKVDNVLEEVLVKLRKLKDLPDIRPELMRIEQFRLKWATHTKMELPPSNAERAPRVPTVP